MWRFNFIVVVLLGLAAPSAFAQRSLVHLGYWNWTDVITVTDGIDSVSAAANFSGYGLQYEYQFGGGDRGWKASATGLFGQATGGQPSGTLSYIASYQSFFGAAADATYYWRIEPRVYLEIGPEVIYRKVAWPTQGEMTAKNKAPISPGLLFKLRFRLSRALDFCQSVGAIPDTGSTVWSTGLGYRF